VEDVHLFTRRVSSRTFPNGLDRYASGSLRFVGFAPRLMPNGLDRYASGSLRFVGFAPRLMPDGLDRYVSGVIGASGRPVPG